MVIDLSTDPYVPTIGSLPFAANSMAALAYINFQRGRTLEGSAGRLRCGRGEQRGAGRCRAVGSQRGPASSDGWLFGGTSRPRSRGGWPGAPRASSIRMDTERGTAGRALHRAVEYGLHACGRIVLAVDDRRHGPGATLRNLLPGVRYDFHDVAGRIDTFASITHPVLLLSCPKSRVPTPRRP